MIKYLECHLNKDFYNYFNMKIHLKLNSINKIIKSIKMDIKLKFKLILILKSISKNNLNKD